MDKKVILLTGSSGMVGKNILEHPEKKRYFFLTPKSNELDLRDYNAVENYIKKYRPDMVIHAAGKVGGIQANMSQPINFFVENIDIGKNVILASYKNGVKKLINFGSSCMYPKNFNGRLTEDLILKGELESTNEAYAIAKIAIARLCDYVMREDKNYHYKTLIPCNLYGRYDKFDQVNSHLVPAILHKLHQAKTNNHAVEIWGDGSAKREFMYAGDMADMVFRAIEHFKYLPNYMNVGFGIDYTVSEYYQSAAEVVGFEGQFIFNLKKPVGMTRKLVNIDRQIEWGWKPRVSLREGLKKTYDFYLSNINI
jgi:GDP-L-fucose synthase